MHKKISLRERVGKDSRIALIKQMRKDTSLTREASKTLAEIIAESKRGL